MTEMSSAQGADQDHGWRARDLMGTNRALSIGVLALLVAMAAAILVGLLGAGTTTVSDATPCTGWSNANQAKQNAYARLYVREHGPLPSGASDPASVTAAINKGCEQAYVSDVEDTVNVVQAITGQ